MNIGDKLIRPYPFQRICIDLIRMGEAIQDEFWQAGCKSNTEDGTEVFEGHCIPYNYFTCDKEGEIELEILSIAEMPARYQDRVICKRTTINPDGERKSTGLITVTSGKYKKWKSSEGSIFPSDYEVED